jgi:hypothetical protein
VRAHQPPDATNIQAPNAVLDYDLTDRLAGARMAALLVHGEPDRCVTATTSTCSCASSRARD